MGKRVKFRFSSMCKSKTGICNKCAGELFYRMGNNLRVGISMSSIPDKLKLISMKSFHDATVQTVTIDPMKAFYPFND